MSGPLRDDRVRIVEAPAIRIVLLEHRGDPAGIDATIARFAAWRRQAGLPPPASDTYNILHGSPGEGPPEAFRLGLGVATGAAVAPNAAGVAAGVIAGGRFAVLRHEGPEAGLGAAIGFLCRDWLPRSGEVLRDDPVHLRRIRFADGADEAGAVTDIFLPLRRRPGAGAAAGA